MAIAEAHEDDEEEAPTEAVPIAPELKALAERVFDLDELRAAGATFLYPQALDTPEWLSLRALHRVREAARRRREKREQEDRELDALREQQARDLYDKLAGR